MKTFAAIGCIICVSFANPAFSQSPGQAGVNDDLRDLLKAASEDGWIEFVPKDENVKAGEVGTIPAITEVSQDCSLLEGIDKNGLFVENPLSDRELNRLLPLLLEGETLLENQLSRIMSFNSCSPEYEIWSYLAASQIDGAALNTEKAITALYQHKPHIRRRAGLSLAIAAGISGDRTSLRRYADMLQDAGLHNVTAYARDPRHILLDALLLETNDPKGAKQRYEWLSAHKGSVQMIAIERLTSLGEGEFASNSLTRLGEDFSLGNPSQITDLKVKAAFETAELSSVSDLLKSGSVDIESISVEHKEQLAERLQAALLNDNQKEKIFALDILSEFGNLLENRDFDKNAELALVSLLGADQKLEQKLQPKNVNLPKRPALVRQTINADTTKQFITDISADINAAQKVLSNG